MNRKSLPEQALRAIAKRTTIYLPSKFKLNKPTQEINEEDSKSYQVVINEIVD